MIEKEQKEIKWRIVTDSRRYRSELQANQAATLSEDEPVGEIFDKPSLAGGSVRTKIVRAYKGGDHGNGSGSARVQEFH